jgi:hypothetical protein
MSPGDLFLSARQLFGYVVPGVVWLCAASMAFLNASLADLIVMASDATVVGIAWFLGLATLAGYVTKALSYDRIRNSTKRRFAALAAEQNEHLRIKAIDRLRHLELLPSHWPAQNTHVLEYDQARQLLTMCKEMTELRAPEFSPKLSEKEAEINLTAMLPAPVLAFALAVAVRADELHAAGILWSSQGWQVWLIWRFGTVAAALWFAWSARTRFLDARVDEEKSCLRLFLESHSAGAESKTPAS